MDQDKNISNINYKINHYLTNLEEGKNNNSSNYNNLRLNILRRKIRKKNKFEILNDQERTSNFATSASSLTLRFKETQYKAFLI